MEVTEWRANGTQMGMELIQPMQMDVQFFKLCKWTFGFCFCFAPATLAIPCVVLLVVLCVALYQSVRSVMCLVTYASLGAFHVILGATIKTVCFIWTPIATTVSVGCQHGLIFVSGYRDFLRKLLDFASPIVRDHYSAPPSPSDACGATAICQCSGKSGFIATSIWRFLCTMMPLPPFMLGFSIFTFGLPFAACSTAVENTSSFTCATLVLS